MEKKCVLSGLGIVILDRGFVFVGKVTIEGDWCLIEKAKSIRYWGTTQGLGELIDGPLPKTKLDLCGTIRSPLRAVIGIIDVGVKWNSVL